MNIIRISVYCVIAIIAWLALFSSGTPNNGSVAPNALYELYSLTVAGHKIYNYYMQSLFNASLQTCCANTQRDSKPVFSLHTGMVYKVELD